MKKYCILSVINSIQVKIAPQPFKIALASITIVLNFRKTRVQTPSNFSVQQGRENLSRQLARFSRTHVSRKHEVLTQCCFNGGPPSSTSSDIETTFGQHLVFAGNYCALAVLRQFHSQHYAYKL